EAVRLPRATHEHAYGIIALPENHEEVLPVRAIVLGEQPDIEVVLSPYLGLGMRLIFGAVLSDAELSVHDAERFFARDRQAFLFARLDIQEVQQYLADR